MAVKIVRLFDTQVEVRAIHRNRCIGPTMPWSMTRTKTIELNVWRTQKTSINYWKQWAGGWKTSYSDSLIIQNHQKQLKPSMVTIWQIYYHPIIPKNDHCRPKHLTLRARLCTDVPEVEDHDTADVVGPALDSSSKRLHQWGVPRLCPHLPGTKTLQWSEKKQHYSLLISNVFIWPNKKF